MPAIDFPSGVCQVAASVNLRTAGGALVSPWNFKHYPQDWGGERWEITIDFLDVRHAASGTLESFLLKTRLASQAFRLGDPARSLPHGSAPGTPVVSGVATAGSSSLSTSGWTASTPGILKAGDYIQIADDLHFILEDADSDGSGNATLQLCPRLRRAHADTTAIITDNPRGLFVRDDNVTTIDRETYRSLPAPLTCIEAL